MDRTLPVRHEILIRKILIVKILTLSSLFYDTGNFLAQFGYILSEVEFICIYDFTRNCLEHLTSAFPHVCTMKTKMRF